MKKIPIILSVIAFVGVVILFFIVLPKKNTSEKEIVANVQTEENIEMENNIVSNIAYIDAQRITNEYEYYKEIAKELEQKQKRAEAEFSTKIEKFQNELNDYQKKVQMGAFLTAESQQVQENELRQKQESLTLLEQNLSLKLQADLQKLDAQAHDTIMKYLKAFNKSESYDLILNSATILDAGQTTDVTDTILSLLNYQYNLQKVNK